MHTYTYINIHLEENYPRTPCWTLPVTSELSLLSKSQYFGERCRREILKAEDKTQYQYCLDMLSRLIWAFQKKCV